MPARMTPSGEPGEIEARLAQLSGIEIELLYEEVARRAQAYVKLDKVAVEDVQTRVVLAFYEVLKQSLSEAKAILEDSKKRSAWVTRQVSMATRYFLRNRVSRPDLRKKALDEDYADLAETIAIDLNEPQSTIEGADAMLQAYYFMKSLKPTDLKLFNAVLEGYARDLKDYEIAKTLKISPATFTRRRRQLMDRFLAWSR
ncbi:MAG TPA: hypothetical protein VHE55_02540 [Fimbriimonadaceae bacterium]|nr:hypothetical protein [Fimbriimonadaceae bacterium]